MSRATPSGRTRIAAAGKTDVGRRRKHNEDSILLEPDLRLFIVADGMGGHNAGEVASALAARSVENFFAATSADGLPTELASQDEHLSVDARRLVGAVRKANADVFEIASTRRQHAGMGSTLVAVHVSDAEQRVHICHVGDSRCYRIRDDQIEQLTRDHSLINDALAMRPDLTEEILAELPKNVITRAVGTQDTLEVDLRSEALCEQDLYVLCSDGLSGLVSAEQILEVTNLTTDLEELCELLVIMANEAGGPDNISVLAFRIEALPSEVAVRAEEEGPQTALADVAAAAQPEMAPSGAEPSAEARDEAEEAAEPVPAEEEAEPVPSGPPVHAHSVVSVGDATDSAPYLEPLAAEPTAPAPGALLCVVCGHEILEDNRFCVECGADAPTEAEAEQDADEDLSPDEALDLSEEAEPAEELAVEEQLEPAAEPWPLTVAPEAVESKGAAPGPTYCQSCGANLLPGNLFCVQCGSRV